MVFYRKYRPQTIAQLDSQAVRNTLTSLLQKDSVHAFLFTGPKGLGKTSTARIVAKVVNCLHNAYAAAAKNGKVSAKAVRATVEPASTSIEPCNACEMCLSITNGNNLDVIEIDAASNRGIDEMRDLKEKIHQAPVSARKKVYIIDEVHMLTTEAFNALLKTLEEPPAHVLFILCTTEQHKVPATILSRCFHIAFQPATLAELVRSFQRIVSSENIEADEDALEAIAELSDAGFRDGVKILEEIALVANGSRITLALVEEKYQVTSMAAKVLELMHFLMEKDRTRAISLIEAMATEKYDLQLYIQKLLEAFHKLLLHELHVGAVSPVSDKTSEFDLVGLQLLASLFGKAYTDMKYAVVAQLPLEIAIIRWCEADGMQIDKKQSVASAPVQKVTAEIKKSDPQPVDESVSVSSLRKQVGHIAKIKAMYGEDAAKSDEPEVLAVETTSVSLLHFVKDGEMTPEWLEAFWKCVSLELKKHNHTLAGVLRSCKIRSFDRKSLVIEAGYQFHKDRLIEAKSHKALEQVCSTLMGNPVVVSVELKS